MTRTRFAPSPTGYLHIGGLRTALYNYLFAKQTKGQFILRIEDTDQKRYVEGAMENLIDTLHRIGLDWDEGPIENPATEEKGSYGPYIQSKRTDIYRAHAQILIEKKAAYRCFCTAERLEEMREQQSKNKQAPMYDRKCANLTEQEIQEKLNAGEPFVIRQKIPQGKKLQFKDQIRGVVNFNTSTVDDQVLIKSDNFPTYHLANVIDDHLMEITHVIRGEEWLPSTPKHILLYEAFGWEPPQFAHIPLLLNKDKSKLSKRQGDVSVESYLEKGYIKEAIINFIALLGWHPGSTEQEIFDLEELIRLFSLEKVHKAGAIFDIEKLNWFNHLWKKQLHHEKLAKVAKQIDMAVKIEPNQKKEPQYIFSSTIAEKEFTVKRGELLLSLCKDHLRKKWLTEENIPTLLKALITTEEKIIKEPSQAEEQLELFFSPGEYPSSLLLNEKMKVDMQTAEIALTEGLNALEKLPEEKYADTLQIQEYLLNLVQKLNLKNGQVLWPLRAALSGKEFSPGTFELIWALGKDETIKRIQNSLKKLK